MTPARSKEFLAAGAAHVARGGLFGVDLEDGLEPQQRPEGRRALLAYLEDPDACGSVRTVVRINRIGSPDGVLDLLSLIGNPRSSLNVVLVPKVEHARDIEIVRELLSETLGPVDIWALIETPLGVENAFSICSQGGAVGAVFGAADLAARSHMKRNPRSLLYARSRLVDAARSGGCKVFDSPYFELDDPDGLREEARSAFELGFDGKAAIHPRQIRVIQEAFRFESSVTSAAEAIVRASPAQGGGAYRLGGRMVGPPLLAEAQHIVETGTEMKDVYNEN